MNNNRNFKKSPPMSSQIFLDKIEQAGAELYCYDITIGNGFAKFPNNRTIVWASGDHNGRKVIKKIGFITVNGIDEDIIKDINSNGGRKSGDMLRIAVENLSDHYSITMPTSYNIKIFLRLIKMPITNMDCPLHTVIEIVKKSGASMENSARNNQLRRARPTTLKF